jgi:hypothetical protein
MLVILALLIGCYLRVRKSEFGSVFYFIEYINFSVYLGWICVATIANTAIMLTSLGLSPEGTLAAVVTSLTLLVAMGIGIKLILQDGNVYLSLVLIWASYGILMARSKETMAGDKMVAVVALVVMIGLLLTMLARKILLHKAVKKEKQSS